MSGEAGYLRHTFRGISGYLVAPWMGNAPHELVAIRHSAGVNPWSDADIHRHRESEEYYLLLSGELQLLIDGSPVTLRPHEMVMVRPGIAHAVVGGQGPIEHFVLRMPGSDDRERVRPLPGALPTAPDEDRRELEAGWGCRVPLGEAVYQNCWLFGFGRARFHSDQTCLAYLNFPDGESLRADRHPHRLHLHRESWEYYAVLQGTRMLQVEDELVAVGAGEIVAIRPGARHVLRDTQTPFEGFTFRVPLVEDKVE